MDNAATYLPEGSRVEVSWEVTATEVLVQVHDHGPGIPEDGVKRLFTHFDRVEGSRIRSGRVGTDLGLFLGRQLAQATVRDVELVATGSEGSTSRFRLPAPATSLLR
jgi:two-component system OmpR family sensor kinase